MLRLLQSISYGTEGNQVSPLQRCLNKAAHIGSLRLKCDHLKTELKELHWLPIEQRINHKILLLNHDDVIKWKHFPRYWPFMRGIHRSPVISPHEGQWRGALMFSLISVWIHGWLNNSKAGVLRRYRAHYDVIVMTKRQSTSRPRPLFRE